MRRMKISISNHRAGEKVFLRVLLVVLGVTAAFPGTAHAYLDPGAGSVIFQVLLAGFLGFLFVLKLFWAKVKGFFSFQWLGKKPR